ncbi:MAG: hypothetical protein ISR65_05395 [Bacteriovoracaceae bacterium]|nr:hypothetical protein [Bacteriovoracaceae bacterium]
MLKYQNLGEDLSSAKRLANYKVFETDKRFISEQLAVEAEIRMDMSLSKSFLKDKVTIRSIEESFDDGLYSRRLYPYSEAIRDILHKEKWSSTPIDWTLLKKYLDESIAYVKEHSDEELDAQAVFSRICTPSREDQFRTDQTFDRLKQIYNWHTTASVMINQQQ